MTENSSTENTEEKIDTLIDRHAFFFETPLYESVNIEMLNEDSVWEFLGGDVDAYNPAGFDTTFNISRRSLSSEYSSSYKGYYIVQLTCRRKHNSIEVLLYITDTTITKVGQFPSLAAIQYAEIGKRYDKVLEKQDLHDLKKAIGLMAYGAGAGSLIYLRRIFENIIWETFQNHETALQITEDDFKGKRMDEKVKILKTYLPSQLVEMKVVYGILSKGIHELSEKECLAYFPALKLSITLILDQKIDESARKEREGVIKKTLTEIATDLSKK